MVLGVLFRMRKKSYKYYLENWSSGEILLLMWKNKIRLYLETMVAGIS